MKVIDIAKEFNPYPSGRFPADGQFNGERFRVEVLEPALNSARASPREKVVVDIDGVRSFGSSFLEEAFGGLIRKRVFTRKELKGLLEVQCTKPHLFLFRDSIESYIDNAQPEPAVH